MIINFVLSIRKKIILSSLIATLFVSNYAVSHEYQHNEILVNHPYALPTRPGTTNGVMYIAGIKNLSQIEEELTGISTPIATTSEIHNMKIVNGMMRMRRISSIILPVNKKISLKKGNSNGYHIMLFKLRQNLNHGDDFNATLHFKNSPSIEVKVEVIMSQKKP
jgi:copper(I)-binding protein